MTIHQCSERFFVAVLNPGADQMTIVVSGQLKPATTGQLKPANLRDKNGGSEKTRR